MTAVARLGAALLCLGLLSACGGSGLAESGDGTGFVAADGSAVLLAESERGEPIEFSTPTVGGGEFDLASLDGVAVLNVWGPWCAPCRQELPELEQLHREYSDAGLRMIGVATRSNDAAVLAFTKKHDITYPQLADYESRALALIPGVPLATVPTTLLLDRSHRLAGWVLGAAEPALLESLAKSLLAEK